MVDAHKNFAYSLVATAPVPATTGTSLVVSGGQGTLFPTVPFNATIWPTNAQPLSTNAEIITVTNITDDTFTIVRAQEGTSSRTVIVGDQIAATITAKTLVDAENYVASHSHEVGVEGDPTLTDGTGGDAGKVMIASVHAWFFTDATKVDTEEHTIAESAYLTLTDDVNNYICADRDTDAWVILTSIDSIDYVRYIPYLLVFKRSGSTFLHKQILDLQAHGEIELHHSRIMRSDKYGLEDGALIDLTVADTTRAISLAGGGVWAVNHRYDMSATTAATRQFECYYDSVGQTWTYYSHTTPILYTGTYSANTISSRTSSYQLVVGKLYKIVTRVTLDFTLYGAANNNAGTFFRSTGAGVLGAGDEVLDYTIELSTDYYSIMYVWRGIEVEDHIYTIYDTTEYQTLELAKASKTLSNIPPLASSHSVLVGRIIFYKDQTTSFPCESAFDTIFAAASAITDHGSLEGLSDDDHPQYQATTGMSNYQISSVANSIYAKNSLFSGTNISGTLNSTAFNLSVAAQTGNFLSTNADTAYAKNSLFAGTNISGTLNSTAFNLSVAAQTGNFLSTNADTAYAKNSLFSGTNISGTLNSTAFALSVGASGNSTSFGYQSATPSQTTGASSVLGNNGAWLTVVTTMGNYLSTNAETAYAKNSLFSGTNISGTLNSTAFALSVAASVNSTSFGSQSATPSQTTGASSVLFNNGAWATVGGGNYLSTNASTSFGSQSATPSQTSGASSVLVNNGAWATVITTLGNYLSTNADSAYAKNSLFAGTNISGTLNSTTFALSVAAAPTILAAHAGTAFSGTNISGTINSTALQLNVAASGNSTSFGSQSDTPSQTTGASSVLVNNGAWATVITTLGNYLSTNASSAYAINSLFAGTNISGTLNSTTFALSVHASQNSTSFGSQSATPSQSTGATSVLANNGAWVTVVTTLGNYLSTNAASAYAKNSLFSGTNISGTLNSTAFNLSVAAPSTILAAHAGTAFSGTNISGTINSTALQLSVGAAVNSTSFGSQSATPSQTTAASSVLYNNGQWSTVGGGNITNNYTGVVAHGLSASTTNNATFGSIWYQGSNITIDMTTNANSSHIMNFSVSPTLFAGRSDWPPQWIASTASLQIATGSAHFQKLPVPQNITITRLDVPMYFSVTTTAASTQNFTLSAYAVIYTNNANTLTPIVGNTKTFGATWGSSGNTFNSLITGSRFLSFDINTVLTPGDYWVGLRFNTATGGHALAKTEGLILNSIAVQNTAFADLGVNNTIVSAGLSRGVGIVAFTATSTAASTIPFSSFTAYSTALARGNFPIVLNNA
jgi:hypothetical protein